MRDKAFVNRKKRDEFNFSEANSEKLSATKFAASSSLLPELRLPVKNFCGIHRFCSYRGNIRFTALFQPSRKIYCPRLKLLNAVSIAPLTILLTLSVIDSGLSRISFLIHSNSTPTNAYL